MSRKPDLTEGKYHKIIVLILIRTINTKEPDDFALFCCSDISPEVLHILPWIETYLYQDKHIRIGLKKKLTGPCTIVKHDRTRKQNST
jgi:hypothetical protein